MENHVANELRPIRTQIKDLRFYAVLFILVWFWTNAAQNARMSRIEQRLDKIEKQK